ncbi:MAG: hypothetical protein HY520_03080 [Candidatus Aenigmarchaeota archaeon]|nr:hypothetical protein [Candidatus Aenigmarchaeota archaeon]
MVSRKAMSSTMEIVVAVVVILVVAFVILTIFSGGTGNAASIIQRWLGQVPQNACPSPATCKTSCSTQETSLSGGLCPQGQVCCQPVTASPAPGGGLSRPV